MRRFLGVMCLLLPVACAPEARWPQETSLQTASPADAPIPAAIATAVEWWTTREPTSLADGPVKVSLAEPLWPARDEVARLLPSCDVVEQDGPHDVAVRAVRMHHMSAQIDLDTPRANRGRQLITLDMRKYMLTPWEVTGANWWRFNNRQLERITRDAVAQSAPSEDVHTEATAAV